MDVQVVVDASVWVSWLTPQDVNHNASSVWVKRFTGEGGSLVAPSFLLIEVAASVARITGDSTLAKQIVDDINSDSTVQAVPLDAALVQAAVKVATELQLRAGDAIYAALAHQLSIPLISWDKEQLQRAESLVPTYTPSTYVF